MDSNIKIIFLKGEITEDDYKVIESIGKLPIKNKFFAFLKGNVDKKLAKEIQNIKKKYERLLSDKYPNIYKSNIDLYQRFIDNCSTFSKEKKINILHATSLKDALFFLKLKRATDISMVVSVKDIQISRITKYNLNVLFNEAELFIVQNWNFKEELIKKGCPEHKIIVINTDEQDDYNRLIAEKNILYQYRTLLLKKKLLEPSFILVSCPSRSLTTPPIGIAYIFQFLSLNNIFSQVIDLNKSFFDLIDYKTEEDINILRLDDKNIYNFLSESQLQIIINKWTKMIIEQRPEFVGFSVYINNIYISLLLAKSIKLSEPRIKIVLGGPHTIDYSGLSDIQYIDKIITGGGKQAYDELFEYFSNETSIKIQSSDKLNYPIFPDYAFIKQTQYIEKFSKFDLFPVITSYGCPYGCKFCNVCTYWPVFQQKDPEEVFSEIKLLSRLYPINTFFFQDALINASISWLDKICDKMIKSGLDVKWGGCFSPQNIPKLDFFDKLSHAGCNFLIIGIESGSNKVLKDMNKRTNLRKVDKMLRYVKELNIDVHISLIVGYPTESDEDFNKTLNFIKKNNKFITSVSIGKGLKIEKGTPLYEEMKNDPACKMNMNNGWDSLWIYKSNTPKIRLERLRKLKKLVDKTRTHLDYYNEDFLTGEIIP